MAMCIGRDDLAQWRGVDSLTVNRSGVTLMDGTGSDGTGSEVTKSRQGAGYGT
jgi:hypothetical protein